MALRFPPATTLLGVIGLASDDCEGTAIFSSVVLTCNVTGVVGPPLGVARVELHLAIVVFTIRVEGLNDVFDARVAFLSSCTLWFGTFLQFVPVGSLGVYLSNVLRA